MSPHWEEIARRSMFHLQFTDCRSLSDHLTAQVPRQCEDKRLSIEMAGLRQSLWVMKPPPPPHTLRIIRTEINCDGYQRTYSSQTVSRRA